jgi:hypothetical protein
VNTLSPGALDVLTPFMNPRTVALLIPGVLSLSLLEGGFMTLHEQIDQAIGAHGMWKARLRVAVESGKSEFDPAVVKTDNKCDFGKWLHVTIAPGHKSSSHYAAIKQLHAEFHLEAGRILQLAVSGQKEAAKKDLEGAGKFSTISASLTKQMMEWKKEIG